MTIHQLKQRTPGEDALIRRAESTAIDGTRAEALALLRREGLPHRRIEAWHYTDLRSLIGKVAGLETETAARKGEESYLAPLLAGSHVVEVGATGAAGDHFKAEGVRSTPDWHRSSNHLDRPFDTVRLINVAFGPDASSIVVDADSAPAPIELRARPRDRGSQSYVTCKVGERARAIFVERFAPESSGALSTAVTELDVAAGAEVLWIVVQEKGDAETHLAQLTVTIGANARLKLFVLNAGGALVRREVHVETKGEGADIQIRGVNLLHDGQHVDVTTTLRHTVPDTTSTETFRNVVTGGHGVFQGMIKVSKGAQKTDARMACNSLLLSDDGDFSAKPELEIFADDVQCGHGATAGEIDADHLFYLMSRGIPEREARALLVKAFVAEVVEELEHPELVEALEARIDAWLAEER